MTGHNYDGKMNEEGRTVKIFLLISASNTGAPF